MKKKIISLLLVLSAFFITSSVSAKEIYTNDIPRGSYIIGTHLFTRDENVGNYDGTLKVQHIMLAARTIAGDGIDNMTIYFKTSHGIWMNAITEKEVAMSNIINIEYKNTETVIEKTKYGDINGDGKVDSDDYQLLLQYLNGNTEFTETQKNSADVNTDGIINNIDAILISEFNNNRFPNTLPTNPITEYTLYGDVNNDGIVDYVDAVFLSQFLDNKRVLDKQGMKNADINGDGIVNELDVKIMLVADASSNYFVNDLPMLEPIKAYQISFNTNGGSNIDSIILLDKEKLSKPTDPTKEGHTFAGWYTDANYSTQFDFENTTITKDTVLYAKFDKPMYGDINGDGKVNALDRTLITRYIAGWDVEINYANADVNNDGTVNRADSVLLNRYFAGWEGYKDVNLPDEPFGKTYVIDYMIDNEIYLTDYTLDGIKISKPTDPTKEGYTFAGWYTNINYNTQFDFDNAIITKDTMLYAKFDEVIPAVVKYGDANEDGVVNGKDRTLIARYLDGWDVEINLANADVNNDGKVNKADEVLLTRYIAKISGYTDVNLPDEPFGKTYIINYMIDNEIYLTDYTLDGIKISKPTDPTKEGYTFAGWYTDENYSTQFDFENITMTKDTVLYAKFDETSPAVVKYGDVNNDGKISLIDDVFLARYLDGWDVEINLANADVNNDGKVNKADEILLARYLGKWKGYTDVNLPDEPFGKTYVIDYMVGNEIYLTDYTLDGIKLSKPEEPTKEGYTFTGWYTDENYSTQFDFENTTITENTVLYAKFYETSPAVVKYGDVNNDGNINYDDLKLLVKYINDSTKMSTYERTVSDLNNDGLINITDIIILHKHISGIDGYTEMPINVEKENLVYGDINGDGRITEEDATYLFQYSMLPDLYPLTKEYALMGDVNLDGQVDISDSVIIKNYINRTIGYEKLPVYDATEVKVYYGDVNDDGLVNKTDSLVLLKYLSGYNVQINLLNADLNNDGKVNEVDKVLIKKYLAGLYPEKNLPNEPLGKSYIIDYMIDNEIYLTDYELEGYKLKKPTNPTKEGYTFVGWYTDENYSTQFDFENTTITENTVLYAKFNPPAYGDVNGDGKVNRLDLLQLGKYVGGWNVEINLANADLNNDGKVNKADEVLLGKYISNWYSEKNLPEESLGKSYIIDYMIDNEIYLTDYELEGYKLKKPTNPTKEGYTFVGWYTDENYSTQFDFENTTITESTVLYAKFVTE